MRVSWLITAMAVAWAGCAAVSTEDVFCRMTAERWEQMPEGRAHALIERYYEVDASVTREEIFSPCKEHEREALEHPERY